MFSQIENGDLECCSRVCKLCWDNATPTCTVFPPHSLFSEKKWGTDPNSIHNKSKMKNWPWMWFSNTWAVLSPVFPYSFQKQRAKLRIQLLQLQRNLRFSNLTYCELKQNLKMLKFSTKGILKQLLGVHWKRNWIATVFPTMELYFKILNRNLLQHKACKTMNC